MVLVQAEPQVTDAVASMVEAVGVLQDGLGKDRAWQLGEAELLQTCGSLARLRSSVEAAYLSAVAEVDRRREGRPDGPRGAGTGIGSSTESFLRTSAPLTPGQARADVAAARALAPEGSLDGLGPQLARGDITRAHVDVGTRCLARIPVHLRTDEQDRSEIAGFFAELAPTRHAGELKRAAAALLERLAPEVADRFDPQAYERRFLDTSTDLTGMVVGNFALDAVSGAALLHAVDLCSAPLPTDAGGRDGRTAAQRRADALTEMAGRAVAVNGPVRGEQPRLVVHTTAEQVAGVLARGPLAVGPQAGRTEGGQDVGPAALRRLACDAVLQRVVWDRDGNLLGSVPLDLGRQARLADASLRRALAARDRGCIIPGCHAKPVACDAHHVVGWAEGGPTCMNNLCLLCGAHHTAVHAGVWLIRFAADGIPYVVPPERIDPLRRPRRAPHHDVGDLLEAFLRRDDRCAEASAGGDREDPDRPDPPPF